LIVNSSTKLLREYIRTVRDTRGTHKLWVFDFDDTLVKTDACTHVTTASGEKFDLSPGEYALYERQEGDVFDYTDFERLINPRPIKWMNYVLHNVVNHHGPWAVVVLSARSYAAPIRQYLDSVGLQNIEVATLDTAAPEAKAKWIADRIERDDLEEVEFFDDSHKNVAAVSGLRHRFPRVVVQSRHIIHNRISSLVGNDGNLVLKQSGQV
jgi:hypothetical protein